MIIIDSVSHRIVREKIVAIRPKYNEKNFLGQWSTVVICEGNVELEVDCEADRLQIHSEEVDRILMSMRTPAAGIA